jgi:hypothetical protein
MTGLRVSMHIGRKTSDDLRISFSITQMIVKTYLCSKTLKNGAAHLGSSVTTHTPCTSVSITR